MLMKVVQGWVVTGGEQIDRGRKREAAQLQRLLKNHQQSTIFFGCTRARLMLQMLPAAATKIVSENDVHNDIILILLPKKSLGEVESNFSGW